MQSRNSTRCRTSARRSLSPLLAAAATAAVAATLGATAVAQVPTWIYDANTNLYPNSEGQPFASPGYAFGANSTRSLLDLGGGDVVLQFDTGSGQTGGDVSSGFEIDAPAPNWNVSGTTGYSVEWRARLDPVAITNRSAAAVFAGNPSNWAFTRFYTEFTNPFNPSQHLLTAEVQSADGNAGGRLKTLGNPFGWHTYRMDVQNGVASLYVDNYHSPVIVKNNLVASGAHAIWFGDGTGIDNGKWQLDYIKSYQSGIVGKPARPNASLIDRTLLSASYDGNTGNQGLDADFARGSTQAVGTGGTLVGPGKFGAGALDPITASGTVNYPSAGNFNVESGTVEMWIKTSNWNDGEFRGFFDIYQANPTPGEPAKCDIRIQKTAGGHLQAYVASADADDLLTSWSVTTSEPLTLDGEWHHLAWSWDENVNMSYLYLDGNVIADFSATFAPPTPNPGQTFGLPQIDFLGTLGPTIEIGSVQDGSAPFNGLIDELRISGGDLYQGGAFTPQAAPFELQKWNVDSDGNWSNAANWTGGVPDSIGATANFLAALTSPHTVTLDGPRTVGILRFDNAAASYTLGGSGTLSLDVGTGVARVAVVSGSHTIAAPVSLQDNAQVTVNPSATLTLSGPVDGVAGVTLTKDGGGTLAMTNLRLDNAVVDAGTLRIQPNGGTTGASRVLTLAVNGSGRVDLTDNVLAVDYDGPSPLSSIVTLINSGRAGGSWTGNGITSSSAAANSTSTGVGYAEASDLGLSSIAGQPVDGTTVIVRFTLLGDANLDRSVNIGDFSRLGANFNQPGGWAAGDFNYDGTVGIADFSLLASAFNQTLPASLARPGAVPEPAALGVLAPAAALALRRRRR